jgi:hypothetical protein
MIHFLVDYDENTLAAGGGGEGGGGVGEGFLPVEEGRVSVIIASHDRFRDLGLGVKVRGSGLGIWSPEGLGVQGYRGLGV